MALDHDDPAGSQHGATAVGHTGHGDDHQTAAEDDRWVLLPLIVGAVIGLLILVLLGFGSGARPFG